MVPSKANRSAMKVFKEKSYTTRCGTPQEWDSLKKEWSSEEKVSVLDLRTATEAKEFQMEDVPEEWEYRRMAVIGSTISEQDVDVFRREQRRHGKLIVLATNDTRGSLLALADISRIKREAFPQDEVNKLDDLEGEKELQDWLKSYLDRHQTTEEMGEI